MKLISRRAKVLLAVSLLFVAGLLSFLVKYTLNASLWAQHPSNGHLYKNGELISTGTIYDRFDNVLLETVDGKIHFNPSKTVRTALMHATGDLNGNVVTGAQVAFGRRLSGWDLINGVYRFKGYNPGNNLTLTLDSKLCATAYNALNGHKGTVGVYNYKTGEILCMVSSPSFDPQNPPKVEKSPSRYEGVYINRLLSGTYTPGSVFKLLTASAAIENLKDYDKKVYHCDGTLELGWETVTCPSAHRDVTLEQALAHSCNVAFAQISIELGTKTLQKYADEAGFNSGLRVSGIQTAAGRVNLAGAEGSNIAWAGIGQYNDMVNPLNFMAYVGAIANGGVRVTPVLIKDRIFIPAPEKKRILWADTARKLGAMMRNDVISVYGEENYKGLNLCAKSGTAEVEKGEEPHSWFVGFLDREDYPLAFVVVVENGGSGSKVAGPIAAKVLKAAVSGAN